MRVLALLSAFVISTLAATVDSTTDTLLPIALPPVLPVPIPTYNVQKQYVTSKDGLQIYCEAVGNNLGPHVMLIPGLATATNSFNRIFNNLVLRASLYLVRCDPRGHGLTGKPVDPAAYMSSRFAEDVDAVVKYFKLYKPFFAGWSLAGAIAVDLAGYYPSPLPFSAFISFAGLPSFDVLPNTTTPEVRTFVPGLVDNDNATNALQTRIDYAGFQSIKKDQIPFEDLAGWVGAAAYLPPLVAAQALGRTQNTTRFFEEGRKGWKVGFFWGDSDRSVILSAVLDYMKPFVKQETYVFANAGHAVFYDAADEVSKKLLTFTYANWGRSY